MSDLGAWATEEYRVPDTEAKRDPDDESLEDER
jgi:endogenous inhibitor of DNA gyrase (YacG/DUF329 family)